MQPEQALKHLLSVLRSHHITLSDEKIRSAFEAESSREDVTTWVQQYLGTETLLSFEEAQLYSRLEKHDIPSRVAASYDLSAIRHLLDEDFETSLKMLEASTSAIEEQTRTLKLQQETLDRFQKSNGRAQTQCWRTTRLRQQNLLQEKQNTSLAADDLLRNLSKHLSVAQCELQAIRDTSRITISNSLKYDDERFSEINRLASSLQISDNEAKFQTSNVEALCGQLKAYMTSRIRCHLDRIYLEAAQSSLVHEISRSSENTDLEAFLKAELGTLYTEIDDVAQMSINHEFSEPLCEMIKREEVLKEDGIRTVLDNIDAHINHLQEKTDNTLFQLQRHESHCIALNIILNELNILGLEKSTNSSISPRERALSPINDDSSLDKTTLQNGSGFHEFTHIKEDSARYSHRQLLQILGCPLSEVSNLRSIQDLLDRAAYTQVQDARIGSLKLSRAIDSSIDLHLDAASVANQTVVDEVLKDTKWQDVQLVDDHLRSRIVELDTEIGRIGSAMGDFDLEKLLVASKESQNFVNNWNV